MGSSRFAKSIKLTAKRKAWAASRKEAPTFRGEPLAHNAALQVRYVDALQSLTAQMTAQVKREVIRLYKTDAASAHFGQDATIASQSRILINALANKFTDLFNKKARPLAERMVSNADKSSTKSLHSSLQKLSGGMSLKTSLNSPALVEITKAAVAENVSLIKSIASEYLQKVEGAVMRSITTGNGLQDLIPAIEQYEGQTHRRAKNIALDQTRKTMSSINRGRMEAIGLKKFMWHHSGGGANPREDHIDMDGQIYRFDDPPVIDKRTGEKGIPGQAINCFPGDSIVEFPNGVNKLFRRWYSGELVSLVADNGVILEATGNHPVLTNRGWIAIKDVQEGDYLIKGSEKTFDVSDANINNADSKFGDVFDSAVVAFSDNAATCIGSALQFHGDGTNEEINIVFAKSNLPSEIDSTFAKQICEFIFAYADVNSSIIEHFVGGSKLKAFLAMLESSDCFVRLFGPLLSLLKSHALSGNDASLRLASYLNTCLNQSSSNDVSSNIEIFSKLKLAGPCNVSTYNGIVWEILSLCRLAFGKSDNIAPSAESLGEIVGIDFENFGNLIESSSPIKQFHRVIKKGFRKFSGFVHNAETPGNWYVINGFIIHNCKCTMSPVFDFED